MALAWGIVIYYFSRSNVEKNLDFKKFGDKGVSIDCKYLPEMLNIKDGLEDYVLANNRFNVMLMYKSSF
jgi:hypothetical protein